MVITESSFKPPPRVTLTDAKRTTWLRDLADEALPLRRLSRTIPHGIRGASLLEQCTNNKIPMTRATWLVKCVGANELRAFKRKGISDFVTTEHEQRWVEHWTETVHTFVQRTFDKDISTEDAKYMSVESVGVWSSGPR